MGARPRLVASLNRGSFDIFGHSCVAPRPPPRQRLKLPPVTWNRLSTLPCRMSCSEPDPRRRTLLSVPRKQQKRRPE
jgi:hypothetical protein